MIAIEVRFECDFCYSHKVIASDRVESEASLVNRIRECGWSKGPMHGVSEDVLLCKRCTCEHRSVEA